MVSFTVKQLEAFAAVVERGSFHQAAEALYLAQSTVSAHVKGLEAALGVALFRREGKKKVLLTREGGAVYEAAREILSRCETLEEHSRPAQVGEVLSVGASSVPAQCILPGLMAGFLKGHKACRYLLRRGDSVKVHELLREGAVRLGFVGAVLDTGEFSYLPILEDQLVVIAANKGGRSLLQGVYGRDLLRREPIIAREEASGTWRETAAYLRRVGIAETELDLVARMENPEAIKNAVIHDMGVSVISALAVREEVAAGRLLQFPLDPEGAWRSIYLVTRREDQPAPLEREFIQYVKLWRKGDL